MIGLAASPGTEVEPMCSIRSAVLAERLPHDVRQGGELARPGRVVVDDHDLDLLAAADEHPVQRVVGHGYAWSNM